MCVILKHKINLRMIFSFFFPSVLSYENIILFHCLLSLPATLTSLVMTFYTSRILIKLYFFNSKLKQKYLFILVVTQN